MARPLFAATTVVSEKLINACLTTYLANVAAPQAASIVVSVPAVAQGTPLEVVLDGEFAIVSAKAVLRPNPQGRITLTFRLYAAASVAVFRARTPGSINVTKGPLEKFAPEIVLSLSADVPLVAQVVGTQFRLGANLNSTTILSLAVDMVSPALPPVYQPVIGALLSDPAVAKALTTALHALGAGGVLPVTTAMVPASYDIKMPRLLQPDQEWFRVNLPVSQLLFRVGAGLLAAGVNVAPFTSASIDDLPLFLPADEDDRRSTLDVQTVANLQFVEDFLNTRVFPLMRNAFVFSQLRINAVSAFTFKTIGTKRGFQPGIEVTIDLTYFTDIFGHFVLTGTTAVDARVTLHAYPYLQYGRLNVELNDVDIELPAWVKAASMISGFALVPFSFAIPLLLDQVLRDTTADLLNGANGGARQNALALEREAILPGTKGPPFRLTRPTVGINANPSFKVFSLAGRMGPAARSVPRLTCNVENTATEIPPGVVDYEIRKTGQLPGFVIVSLFVPDGLIHPADPSVRVRWEVLFNGRPVPAVGRDVRLREPNARELRVLPILFTNPDKSDQELSITCRLYRPLGTSTDEFLNQRINVFSVDPRPDELKPYVKWGHWVTVWNGYKRSTRFRDSKIHKIPGKGGCRFSNQYLNVSLHGAFKFGYIRHLVDLPFDQIELEANRALVCPYCFFGGPDKHAANSVLSTIDLASHRLGRVKSTP
jgi:hypothetical protein